jgi:hypothetical protein
MWGPGFDPHYQMCMCVCYIFYIHSSVDRHLDCFHFLYIAVNTEINTGGQMSLKCWFEFFWLSIYSVVGLLDHMVVLLIIFWRNLHIVSPNAGTYLDSHQQCTRDPFFLHPSQHLLPLLFLRVAILTLGRWLRFGCAFTW